MLVTTEVSVNIFLKKSKQPSYPESQLLTHFNNLDRIKPAQHLDERFQQESLTYVGIQSEAHF